MTKSSSLPSQLLPVGSERSNAALQTEAQGAHLREDAPPLPVPQLQVRGAVPLQDL